MKALREHVQNGIFISEQGVYHVNYILFQYYVTTQGGFPLENHQCNLEVF